MLHETANVTFPTFLTTTALDEYGISRAMAAAVQGRSALLRTWKRRQDATFSSRHRRLKFFFKTGSICPSTSWWRRTVNSMQQLSALFESTGQSMKARSKLSYLTSLNARINPPNPLVLFRKGLALEPVDQAPSATWTDVKAAMRRLSKRSAMGLYLGWRTACRMDEVENLTGKIVEIINGIHRQLPNDSP
jgi:hypothetical protein